MTNNKHTPGPWLVSYYYGEIYSQGNRVICKLPTDRLDEPTFNNCERMGCREVDYANADLITTAPDMLEALEEILAGCVAHVEAGRFVEQLAPRIERLQKIVNKAKGE